MNRLWWDWRLNCRVRQEVRRLAPWYHPHCLPGLILTRPLTREVIAQWWRAERGKAKWDRFILPVIRDRLPGATVLELGTNSGLNLVCALRAGASYVIGVEPDHRYYEQALLVRQCLGLQDRLRIVRTLSEADGYFQKRAGGLLADIGLLCAVLRHIPDNERVPTLDRMGRLCQWVLIQGSGLADAPPGDSADSVLRYVFDAGLRVERVACENHVRGLRYLVTAKSR